MSRSVLQCAGSITAFLLGGQRSGGDEEAVTSLPLLLGMRRCFISFSVDGIICEFVVTVYSGCE